MRPPSSSWSRRFAPRATTFPPAEDRSRVRASRASPGRSVRTREHPSSSRARAICPPRPPAAPVIRALAPLSCTGFAGRYLLRFLAADSARCLAVAVCFGFTFVFDPLGFALPPELRFFGAGFGLALAGLALPLEVPFLGFALGAVALDPELFVTFASPLPSASTAAASSATLSAVGASSSRVGALAEVPFPS